MRRLESQREAVLERGSRLRAEGDELRLLVAQSEAVESAVGAADAAARQEESAAGAALREADENLRQAEADFHRWTARRDALIQAVDAARAEAGAERLAGVGGVVGTLLELVDVDAGFELAFEAASGEALSAVLLDGTGSAREAIRQLQQASMAGAVVALPESGPGLRPFSASAAGVPASGLRGRVRGRLPAVESFLDGLLQNAVVAEGGWQEAIDLALARPDLLVVTRTGDRFLGGLWKTGASGSGATGAALDDARRQAEAASERVAETGRDQQAARARAESARDQRVRAAREDEASTVKGRAAAASLSRTGSELGETELEVESFATQVAELAQRIAADQARVAVLTDSLPGLEQSAAAQAERLAAERAARNRLSGLTASVETLRRELEVKAAGLEERQAIIKRRLREVEDHLQRHTADRQEAAARRIQAEAAVRAASTLHEVSQRCEADLDAALMRLREARRIESEATHELSNRLEQLRRQRSTAERHLAELKDRARRIDVNDAEARVRLEAVVEAIRRDLECEPDSVRGAECPDLPPGTSINTRRTELERELRLMGPINPLALEEHAALEERHQFLEGQLDDVRNARRDLAKLIRAVDAEIVEVFGAAFADVADSFEKLFAILFPGGEGRLRLSDPDHLLDTGIEIEARPSGKNLRRLSLLSGGERSLAALAFLFAVFRARPSPFYMLDEVEAALDDVNLHRFLDLIHEFRSQAQLLIVSHQKRTMEAADCLYGVTMAPGGSSRVVSERVTSPTG
jgi:chromosome segregation protein